MVKNPLAMQETWSSLNCNQLQKGEATRSLGSFLEDTCNMKMFCKLHHVNMCLFVLHHYGFYYNHFVTSSAISTWPRRWVAFLCYYFLVQNSILRHHCTILSSLFLLCPLLFSSNTYSWEDNPVYEWEITILVSFGLGCMVIISMIF